MSEIIGPGVIGGTGGGRAWLNALMEKEDVLDIAANETFAPIMLKITTKVKTDIKFFVMFFIFFIFPI